MTYNVFGGTLSLNQSIIRLNMSKVLRYYGTHHATLLSYVIRCQQLLQD